MRTNVPGSIYDHTETKKLIHYIKLQHQCNITLNVLLYITLPDLLVSNHTLVKLTLPVFGEKGKISVPLVPQLTWL